MLQGSCIPYKVWGTIRVIDSYKVPASYMWGDPLQGSCIPYKEWGTISHWQFQGSHIPYKVWGTIRVTDSHKVPASYMWGTPLQGSCIPYKVWGTISHWQLQGSHIPYQVWGDHQSLTVTRFPQWTLIMKTLHIDNYKVPAVVCPCPWGLGALIYMYAIHSWMMHYLSINCQCVSQNLILYTRQMVFASALFSGMHGSNGRTFGDRFIEHLKAPHLSMTTITTQVIPQLLGTSVL